MVTAAATPRARAGARYALPFAGIVLVASLLAPAERAFAQSPPGTSGTSGATAPSSQPQADTLFAEGRELLEKGKFPEACAKLARSEELAPAVGTLLNLAYCYEQVGKLRSAMDAYGEAERLANVAGETKRATFAKERFAAVEPRAPKLVVRVVPPEAPGLAVKRNGTQMVKTDLDRPIAVDPQDYLISASAPGYVGWKGAIIVRGEAAVVTVVVPPLEAIATAPVVVAPTSPVGIRRIAALGLGAVSAVAIGAGIGAGLGAKSRYDDARSHCDATGCDETGASIQRGAVGQGNLATALIALGVLAGAGGIYLWIIGAPDEKPAPRSVRLDPSPLRTVLGGRF